MEVQGLVHGLRTVDTQSHPGIVETKLQYMVRDPKHKIEKPYELRYNIEGPIPQTNLVTESLPVTIHDFYPYQTPQSFEDYGFATAKINCAMQAAELTDDEVIKKLWYPAASEVLRRAFPKASQIKILEHDVSLPHKALLMRF
jgi:hypothetical protein